MEKEMMRADMMKLDKNICKNCQVICGQNLRNQ